MGAIAESIVAYAQPLIDETDGSPEQTRHAFSIAQICWNLALLPESEREGSCAELRSALGMNDAEFADYRQSVILPMIQRHQEMFPNMPKLDVSDGTKPVKEEQLEKKYPEAKYPGTGRNAPCPCGSRKKYKRCCGR